MILLTGASGFVGGRLLELLAARGLPVRCLSRHPEKLRKRVPEGVEVVQGDLLEMDSLQQPLQGVETVYYLVHFLGEGGDFEDLELRAARYFARAAAKAGVRRIIYVGGLGKEGEFLSPHLRTRHEVGRILRESGVPTLELRASIVIGRDSYSFKMLQNVVRLMPVVVSYDWVRSRCQPIAVDDLLAYLLAALGVPLHASEIVEIGGPEVVTYGELMQRYAAVEGMKPIVIPSPIAVPIPQLPLSWLHDFAPREASIGVRLIESMKHDTVVTNDRAEELFHLQPMGLDKALQLAKEQRNVGSSAAAPAQA